MSFRLCLLRYGVMPLVIAVGQAGLFAPLAQAQNRDCVRNLAGETVCPPPRTVCLPDRDGSGVKCSPLDGGILENRYGKASCGAGSCAADVRGDIFCSKSPGGAASVGQYGDVVCTNGCEPASPARCTTLSK